MIAFEGNHFTSQVTLKFPWAQRIADLAEQQIEKQMCCGITSLKPAYKGIPDPGADEITHLIDEVKVIDQNTLVIKGHYLGTDRGKTARKMVEVLKPRPDDLELRLNMYAVDNGTKKSMKIDKLQLCTIDVILNK